MKARISAVPLALLIVTCAACNGSNASPDIKTMPAGAGIGSLKDTDIDLWVGEALRLDPRIQNPDDIDVNVEFGIVKLTGKADNLLEKRYAVLEAEKIAGVRGVVDEITLVPGLRTDEEIRTDVARRLSDRPSLGLDDLHVAVDDGVVTLHGTVRSLHELKHAEQVAMEVRGVREIRDLLEVSYRAPGTDDDNRDQIVAALDLDPYLTGLPIEVKVRDGVATLEGTVGNLYERRRAEEDAWRVASINRVENRLVTDWVKARGTRDMIPIPSDAEIEQAVRDALLQDLRIARPADITVRAEDGGVTLEGKVPNGYERTVVESDAENVVGVQDVINVVQVEPEHRDDTWVANEVRLDLATDTILGGLDLGVQVHGGVATLSGNVDTSFEMRHAEDVARRTPGVKNVINELVLTGRSAWTDTALHDRVAARLRSNQETRPVAERIGVRVEDGVATLTGRVDTWYERFEAEHVALRVDGIHDVVNKLVVGTL